MAKRSKDLIKFVVTEKDRLAFTVNTEYNNMLDYLSKRLENLHEEEDIPFEEYKELSKRILKCLATLKLSFNSFDDSIEEMFEEYNLEQYRNKGIAKSSNIKERSSDSKEQSSEPDIDAWDIAFECTNSTDNALEDQQSSPAAFNDIFEDLRASINNIFVDKNAAVSDSENTSG